jgi:acetyltransferase-like isoleucine patch superfamily enzyme
MINSLFQISYQALRRLKYKLLSNNRHISGSPICNQPVQFCGKGEIQFNGNVLLGYNPSPFYFNGVIYLEARREGSVISFGSDVFVNNNLTIICENSKIEIGNDVLIGTNVEILDSDFHEVHPSRRNDGQHICKPIKIGNNVFIGNNVKILKGVTIGQNSIVANGAIVTKSFPENVIIGGNPAVVIRTIAL